MTQRSARLEHAIWLVSIAATRLPVAMTPLAMVFLGSQLLDSYAHGLVLAGLFAVAEACCAPLLGVRLSPAYFRREATVGLLLSAGAYSTVAILGGAVQPAAWLIAVLAGGGAAAVPGVLRTAVGNIVHGDQMHRSFSLEVGVTMACWAVAPALVAALSFSLSPRAVFAVCGLLLLAGAVSVRVMPEATAVQKPVREAPGTTRWASLSVLWPIFISAGLAMSIVSFVELLLPAMLVDSGENPARAGVLLSAMAIASIGGVLLYGWLRIPGAPAAHSWLALTVMTVAAGAAGLSVSTPAFPVLLCVVGVAQSVCIVARNLTLRQQLRPDLHVVGFSLLYSLSGLGYGLSAAAAAVAVKRVPAQSALVIGVVIAAIAAVAVGAIALRNWKGRTE
ncbi:hypothetical protein [Brevibacterium luteolum]|uniref:hypothetical protein n=1 Tax=Brevibacterium luteolum TaxID=199591 RepID=UPI001C240337|nr:hypothetical protein [Brevibacterium luteolum]MBU8578192.1 hypothetical protein [Brevibacterium luteolum]